MAPEVGTKAPDLRLPDASGRIWSLSEVSDGGSVHLVFLRHLAHVRRIWDQRELYLRAKLRPVLISFVGSGRIVKYLENMDMPSDAFLILIDRDRASYRGYGMGSSVSGSWSLDTLAWYVRNALGGEIPERIREDPNQLGGDFVVADDGTILLSHPSKKPIDRASVSSVLASVGIPTSELPTDDGETVPDACAIPSDD